ncbi:MAG TPA: CPBP family intramembrane glutamic endopeptidase [Pyrinomonadaceae bacterium]
MQTPNPNNPSWGIGGALLVWLVSILLVVFMPLLFLIPYIFYSGAANSLPALVEFASKDRTAILLQLLAVFPSHLITFLLVWLVVTRFGRQSFRAAIGLEFPTQFPWWLDLLLSVGVGIALFVVGSLIAKLLGASKSTQLEQIINSSLAARYTISFLAVFTAPFVEEFIYRGVLYSALQKTIGIYGGLLIASAFGEKLDQNRQERLGVSGAVVVVLVLFTIIHVPQYWPNFGVIAAVALLSIVLTLVRAFSRRLLPCVVIHFVFNGIQAALLIVEPFLHRFLPAPDQVAPTAGLLLSLIGLRF